MGLVVPESCISTVDAYSQMLKADSEWCRCSEGWEAAGRSYLPILAAPTIAEIDERQEALSAKLYRAVTGGEIALFAYAGGRLLRVYSDDPRVESELRIWGRIRAPIGDSPERREIDKAPLCFREADWRAWFAPSETPPPAIEQPTEPKAEQPKMVRRTAGAKPRKPTFDEVSAWYAQRVADHDPKQLPPTRPEDEKVARHYFATKDLDGRGIRELVRRARNKHAPASWKETGAKCHEAYVDNRKARAPA